MKHTKGEWYYSFNNEDFSICSLETENTIAYVRIEEDYAPAPITSNEATANAKLISAAPIMLEALKEAKVLLEVVYKDDSSFGYKSIVSAIKKATY